MSCLVCQALSPNFEHSLVDSFFFVQNPSHVDPACKNNRSVLLVASLIAIRLVNELLLLASLQSADSGNKLQF